MKTTIYFVRHGEVYNPKKIWYGRLPGYGLSEKGRRQIAQTASFLAEKQIDALYTSPLLRARQTTEILNNRLSLPAHRAKDLVEIKSSLQGTSFAEIAKLDYDVFAGAGRAIVGESIDEVAARMQQFIQRIATQYHGKRVVAVSHGDPLMLVRAIANGLPITNASLRPTDNSYVSHGEIYLVQVEDTRPLVLSSVFTPTSV